MKINSTQLSIILGLAAVGVLYVVGKKAADAAVVTAKQTAWAVTPWNNQNIIAQGVNSLGGSLVTDPQGPGKNADGSWTLGGFLYDVTHPAPPTNAPPARTVPNGSIQGLQDVVGNSDSGINFNYF